MVFAKVVKVIKALLHPSQHYLAMWEVGDYSLLKKHLKEHAS